MATRIIVGLTVIAAVVQGLWPGIVPENILPLVIVVLGLVYGVMCLDAEDATAYLAVAIAVGGAAATDVLGNIHFYRRLPRRHPRPDQRGAVRRGRVRIGNSDLEPGHAVVRRGLTIGFL